MGWPALQAIRKNAMQSGECGKTELNLLKKYTKVFFLALPIIFFISPIFSQESTWLPDHLGSVVATHPDSAESRVDSSGKPFIVYIEDAHDSYEVQRKIALMVRFLVDNHGFNLVVEEGNAGEVSTQSVFWFRNQGFRKRLAHHFLKEKKITGAEFAQILSPGSFDLRGAEEKALYERHLRLREELSLYQTEVLNALREIESALRRRVGRVFSADLARYCDQSQRFWRGTGTPPFQVGEWDKSSEADGWRRLLDLDRESRGRLVRSTLERKLLAEMDLVGLLKKLARLEVTREDLEAYRRSHRAAEKIFRESQVLREYVPKALHFYALAQRRNAAMLRNTLNAMASSGRNRAIVVGGGFHREGICELLRTSGIPYRVLAPYAAVFSSMTLRGPNLFNLSSQEARLYADLEGMKLIGRAESRLYRALEKDAARLWKTVWREATSGHAPYPVPRIPGSAAVVVPLMKLPSPQVLGDLSRWMEAVLESNSVEMTLGVSRGQDRKFLEAYLKDHLPKSFLPARVRVVRLLTSGDFGSLNRGLQGKHVFLIGERSEVRRLLRSGFSADQVLRVTWTIQNPAQEQLFRELYELQKTYRSIVISA